MSAAVSAAGKLAAFRARHGVSLRQAARLLGVSAPTVLDWERCRKVPSPASRRAIHIWTDGHIRAEEWATSRELALEARARLVRPLQPGAVPGRRTRPKLGSKTRPTRTR